MLNPCNTHLCNMTEIQANPQNGAILPLILPSRKSTIHNSIQFKNGLRTRNFCPRRTFRHTGCDLACRRQSPRQSALVDRRRRLTSPSECSSGRPSERPSECSSEFSSKSASSWWDMDDTVYGDGRRLGLSADVRRCLCSDGCCLGDWWRWTSWLMIVPDCSLIIGSKTTKNRG